jgi:hypothetical protein
MIQSTGTGIRRNGRMRVADYIDRNILCQAYVHIELPDFDDAHLANLKKHLELFVSTRGRFFLYEDVATDVEFKSGSLKLYLTIAGSLYVAIGQYGSFRDGVNFLAGDTKRLAECVVSESLFLTKSRHDTTIRAEARIGVTGTLKSAVDRLSFISSQLGDIPLQKSTEQIGEVHDDIGRLIENLNDPADPPYIADELCKVVKEFLPSSPPVPGRKKPKPSEAMVAAYRKARLALIDELSNIAHPLT